MVQAFVHTDVGKHRLDNAQTSGVDALAQKLLKFAYQLGKENRPKGQSAAQLGQELTTIAWSSKKPIPLPPSAKK